MRKFLILGALALSVAGCTNGPALESYRGFTNAPPYEQGECLVLGRDNVWRRCQ